MSGLNSTEWLMWISKLQSYSLHAATNPLAVPILYGLDSVHGAGYIYGATLFPHVSEPFVCRRGKVVHQFFQNIGLAATWNTEIVQQVMAITARESR